MQIINVFNCAYLFSNYQKVSVFHGTNISQSSKSFCQSLKGSEILGLCWRKCINHTLKINCSFVQLLLYNLCSQLHPDHYILTIHKDKENNMGSTWLPLSLIMIIKVPNLKRSFFTNHCPKSQEYYLQEQDYEISLKTSPGFDIHLLVIWLLIDCNSGWDGPSSYWRYMVNYMPTRLGYTANWKHLPEENGTVVTNVILLMQVKTLSLYLSSLKILYMGLPF